MNRIIADLHVHSGYSRATSKDINFEGSDTKIDISRGEVMQAYCYEGGRLRLSTTRRVEGMKKDIFVIL